MVNFREVENLLDGKACAKRVADEKNPFRVWHAQFAADDVARDNVAVAVDFRADAPRFVVVGYAAATLRTPSIRRSTSFSVV